MKALLEKLNSHAGEFNVSLIVPVDHESFDKEVNRNRVKEAIKEGGNRILDQRPDFEFLIDKMHRLYLGIDWSHPKGGIGIFVSPAVSELVYFQLPVTEKIIVGDEFETRDLVYELTQSEKFLTLIISKNQTRLFRNHGNRIEEIENESFPLRYVEEFDFAKPPSRIRSSEGVEETRVKETREKDFLRKVDKHLDLYLQKENLPLVVGGTREVLSLFDEITSHHKSIAGKIYGSWDYNTAHEISAAAREEILLWHQQEKEMLISSLREAVGAHKCVWGVADVWQAAIEGKCDTLVVEKDYMRPAMMDSELFTIHLDGKTKNFSPRMDDVVNNIINIVLGRNGKVVFTNNNELGSFDKIASLLRY